MAYLLAVVAALTNAVTSVLQRIGVEEAPASSTLRWSLISYALRHWIWVAGFGLMLVEFGLQATALRFGDLTVVQPLLTTELLFLLVILGVWFHYRLTVTEWTGSALIVAGLGGFFAASAPTGGHAIPGTATWVVTTILIVAAIAGLIVGALRGPRWWRAAAFGAAASVTAAYTAALTKAITTYTTEGWGHVFTHFQPYALGVAGLGTVFLLQNALHAGPITASRTTLVTVNPLLSIVLGITLFHDHLRSGPGWTALQVAALAVLMTGAVVLGRSPLVAGIGPGKDPEEMLGRARAAADAPVAPLAGGVTVSIAPEPAVEVDPAT